MGRPKKEKAIVEEKDVFETKQEKTIVEEKSSTEKNLPEKENSVLDFDFDKINAKIQKSVNSALEKKNLSAIDFLDDDDTVSDFIDTGNLAYNYAISGKLDGGFPVGRISEISGDPSKGKSFLATILAINSLRKGFVTYFLDSEMAYDINFAKLIARSVGANEDIVKKMNYDTIDSAEEMQDKILTIVEVFEKNQIKTGLTIIVDGIAFLTTEKETSDVKKGKRKVDMTKAKLLRQFMRTVKNKIKHINTAIIFTNQLTYNIGVMFGPKKTTTGGTAIPFASSVRVEVNSSQHLNKSKNYKFEGLQFSIVTRKSRLTTPYKKAVFSVYMNGVINRNEGLFDLLYNYDVIEKVSSQTYKLGSIEFKKKDFETVILENKANYKKLEEMIEFRKTHPAQVEMDDLRKAKEDAKNEEELDNDFDNEFDEM